MKLTTSVTVKQHGISKHVCIELDLDNQSSREDLSEKTKELIYALQQGVSDHFSPRPFIDVTPKTSQKNVQNGLASERQKKYLNDLTSKCGTTLNRWCKDHGVKQDSITGAHCKAWIPELNQKIKEKMNDDEKFFMS